MSSFKVTKEWTDGSGNTYSYDWGFDTEKYAPPKCLLYCARKFDPTAFVCIKCKGETPMVKEKVSYKECYEKRRTDNARHYYPFAIKNVIFNPPATIVFWEDGTKTVVKATYESFDPEKGLAMAIAKKALGNKGNYFNQIKKWTKLYEDKNTSDVVTNALAMMYMSNPQFTPAWGGNGCEEETKNE